MSDGPRYLHQLKLIPENVEFRDLKVGDLCQWQYREAEVTANRFNSQTGRGCVVFRKDDNTYTQHTYGPAHEECVVRIAVPLLLPLDGTHDYDSVVEEIRLQLELTT
jgi:hypothetical protein